MNEQKGSLNERLEAIVTVKFEGGNVADFLIDTGFDGHLCLPAAILPELNLKPTTTAFIFGVGNFTEEYELGKTDIIWCGRKLTDVEFLVNDGADFLLGTALLAEKELYINYKTGEVLISSINDTL